MKVLSLFDGISCGFVALKRIGIKVEKYIAYEINEEAKAISRFNHPEIIHKNNVLGCDGTDYQEYDLLLGGSPCQDLSIAMSNRQGLTGPKSSLFFEYVRILKEMQPAYFLFENVGSMKQEDKDIISDLLEVKPICINSSLVSAALRKRYYWTNIPNITQPEDRHILLQDILESGYTDRKKARALLTNESRPLRNKQKMIRRYNKNFGTLIFDDKEMSPANCRYMTQIELERCMTLPVGYTQILPRDKAAYHIGNGWTIDVIVHILSNLTILSADTLIKLTDELRKGYDPQRCYNSDADSPMNRVKKLKNEIQKLKNEIQKLKNEIQKLKDEEENYIEAVLSDSWMRY